MKHAPRGDPDVRHRWVFAFQVDGDLRFVSHHDMLRLFRRALARAEVPVRFTQGFNPHPRMSLPLPRPVGMASEAEALMIETERDVDPDDMLARLAQHTPADLQMVSARRLALREGLEPELVRYRFRPEPPPRSSALSNDLKTKVRLVLDAETIPVERTKAENEAVQVIDIRPYIENLSLVDDVVEFTLRVTQSGTARPSEVVGALGYRTESINHQIRRIDVQWRQYIGV
ncbi:MAG: DUF2344 domain-containing protein [Planctomycetes bacterium]|nr:DUF2344 domain-containing protein [Planctomycetota bacterium]